MKLLQNKSTGEIGCLECSFAKTPEKITVVQYIDGKRGSKVWYYDSLAELNAGWEDYEEPKRNWFIGVYGNIDSMVHEMVGECEDDIARRKQIGNYFETKEEAEKAAEKLKALKRLREKGFKFRNWFYKVDCGTFIRFEYIDDEDEQNEADLDLLFGGEE